MPNTAISTGFRISSTNTGSNIRATETKPLFGDRTAWRIVLTTLLGTALVQLAFIAYIGNQLAPPTIGDPYSEANVLRASQGFNEHGITWHYGLSDVVYGDRFPGEGWSRDLYRFPLKDGVYTRYPPLPEWIAAGLERVLGFQRLWAFRLFPTAIGLLGLAFLIGCAWWSVGPDRAALLGAATALLPVTQSQMSGLHYEGYAQSLLLVELGLLMWQLWRRATISAAGCLALGALGFIQGYLSVDYAFIVTFAAVPLWLLRRATRRDAENAPPGVSALLWGVVAPGVGFTLAHAVHFTQVAAFYGSVAEAMKDLSGRAVYRAVGSDSHAGVAGFLGLSIKALAKMYFAGSDMRHFGAWRDFIMLVCAMILWTGPGRFYSNENGPPLLTYLHLGAALPAVAAALIVSCIWYVLMPDMTIIHVHILPRLQFLWVFVMSLTIVLAVKSRTA